MSIVSLSKTEASLSASAAGRSSRAVATCFSRSASSLPRYESSRFCANATSPSSASVTPDMAETTTAFRAPGSLAISLATFR